MLRYEFDNTPENRRYFEAALARKQIEVKVVSGGRVLKYDDYEIADLIQNRSFTTLRAYSLTGPGSMVLELINEIEDLMLNGDDPMGDHMGRNS